MNHSDGLGSGGRRSSRGCSSASSHLVYRPEIENPITVDRSSDESSGSRDRGFRGRGRCSALRSVYANVEHSPVLTFFPNKSSQVSKMGLVEMRIQHDIKSEEDGLGSYKKPDEGSALKFSTYNTDLLQSSQSSRSKNVNLGGCSFFSKDRDVKLVKQMRDVGLSYQEFVSSKSPQRIELSGVMDHDNVHKSGDAGNSSIESYRSPFEKNVMGLKPSLMELNRERKKATMDHDNARKSGDAGNYSNKSDIRPFDLFVMKNVMGLKPSLIELHKGRKKVTKGYTGIVIRPGMVLLKNYLSINDQVMIVNKCRELGLGEGGFYQPGYGDGSLLHLKMMCLGKNWEFGTCRYGETRPIDGSTPPNIPVEFNQFVEKAIKESQFLAALKGDDVIPFMLPDICILNFYESTGRLGLHQDKGESKSSIRKGLPIVSFSIGDSAEFLYGDERDVYKADNLLLESGDVLLFGGKSRSVFHGVRSILRNTAPKVLGQETNLRPGRLNLTFRQY